MVGNIFVHGLVRHISAILIMEALQFLLLTSLLELIKPKDIKKRLGLFHLKIKDIQLKILVIMRNIKYFCII